MAASDILAALQDVLRELVHGTPPTGGVVLNAGDAGLLASLERLTPDEASTSSQGGASIAAHVAHVSYGLSLLNRWATGEEPFSSADWTAAWRVTRVSESEWERLRGELRSQAEAWIEALASPRDADALAQRGMIGSVVHLGYHLGAIRQIQAAARGPRETSAAGS